MSPEQSATSAQTESPEPIQETTTPQPTVSPVNPVVKKGISPVVWIALLALVAFLFLVLGAAAMWFYNENYADADSSATDEESSEETEEENTTETPDAEETEDDEDEIALDTFEGDVVTAELPDGWTIVEYMDGAGSDMLVDVTSYTGLTGLSILKPGDIEIFHMNAVDGIGGTGGCDEYFQFSDNSVSYYNNIVNESNAVGMTTTVVPVTDGSYTEFTLFGTDFRRVDDTLYWDTIAGNNYFEAGCGISFGFVMLDDMSFDGSGYTSNTYQLEIPGTPTEAELIQLDAILESLDTL